MAIYALLDWEALKKYNMSIKDFCSVSNELNASLMQYRDKNSQTGEKLKRLTEIKKYWEKPLIIDDTVELLPFCDGIHIGQTDLEKLCDKFSMDRYKIINLLKNYGSKSPAKIVGLSTHNKQEILEANKLPLSYIGLGAYRKTSTKKTDNILGEKIKELIDYSLHPVAVIGGVKLNDNIQNAAYKVIASDICKFFKHFCY